MPDQADKLRSLVTTVRPAEDEAGGGLPMVVVTGGRAGVGATTVALNLAAVMADRGERVLLIDGAQQRNDVIEPAGVGWDVKHGLSDVLAGRCVVGEAIVQGPAGMWMLPSRGRVFPKRGIESRRDSATCSDFSRHAQQRLLTELESIAERFDLFVVDAGRGLTPWSRRFWSRAKLTVLVTTPDDAAVLDTYAVLKQRAADAVHLPLRLLVNQAASDAEADDAHRRMEFACQRFLSQSIAALPAMPRHLAGELLGTRSAPRVWEMPNTPFGHAALWLGRAVNDLLAEGDSDSCATACGARDRVEYLGSTARC